jgi:hypothetical protein
MKKLTKFYFLRKIVKIVRTFKKNPKEVTFIDKPIRVKTYNPENRGSFNETFCSVYQQLKSK